MIVLNAGSYGRLLYGHLVVSYRMIAHTWQHPVSVV